MAMTILAKAILPLAILATAGSASAASPAPAVLAQFEAALDASPSATAVLTAWCADHRLADPPVVVAVRARGADKPASAETRRLLGAAPGEVVRYRRVRLACGAHVLSEADNWYRPALLTAEMNARLDASDTPFGAVVKPLNFHRKTLDVRWLKPPETGVLRHRALLVTGEGATFSLVVETYTDQILAGSPPPVER